jgi:Putative binding domain, N-terminal/Viral BACON domain
MTAAAAHARHTRVIRLALILMLLSLSAVPLRAQSILDGGRVEFQPSPDNDTVVSGTALVSGYSLNIYVAGSGTVVSTANLGKPTPESDGFMRVAYLPLLTTPLQVGVTYEARVSANGPGGSSSSTVSNTFALTSVCGTSTIAPPSVNVGAGASTGSVAVTSTCGWGSIINANWITVTSGASGNANGTLNYSVAANPAMSPRSGTITVAGNTFTVNQAAATCSYSIGSTSQSVGVDGGTGSVTVTAGTNCGWTAASNNTPWLTVTSGAAGSGSGSVGFSVTANNLTTTRNGTLTIAGATFTVNQAACGYTITPTSQTVAVTGGTGSVTVTTGTACPWTAVSNAGWVSVTSGATGTGSGSVGFSATGNISATLRSGTITIGGKTFTVNETGCSYSVAPTAINVNYTATSGTLTMTTSPTCVWAASTSVTWVTLGAGGTGSGTVSYALTANLQPASRTTNLLVGGQQIGVTQGGATPPSAPSNVKIIR